MGGGALPRAAQRKIMKLYTLALIAVLSFASIACGQSKPVGYDVAACSPTAFSAVHAELSDDAFTITMVSPGPGEVVVLPEPVVYKFDHKDKDGGRYYISGKHIVVIDEADKVGLVGKAVDSEGNIIVIIFGAADSDGKALASNAQEDYNGCRQLFTEEDPKENKS